MAASTPENLNVATNDREKLAAMLKNKTVVRLKEGIKVRALERSFEHGMLKIKFLNNETPYWVRSGALEQIKEDEK